MMNKIKSYIIAAATKNNSLEDMVSFNIESGFQPYCGPYLDRNGIEKQAMVVYEESPTTKQAKPKKKEANNED